MRVPRLLPPQRGSSASADYEISPVAAFAAL
jgi:hypothetical protein